LAVFLLEKLYTHSYGVPKAKPFKRGILHQVYFLSNQGAKSGRRAKMSRANKQPRMIAKTILKVLGRKRRAP
jgi:hypothetical protein